MGAEGPRSGSGRRRRRKGVGVNAGAGAGAMGLRLRVVAATLVQVGLGACDGSRGYWIWGCRMWRTNVGTAAVRRVEAARAEVKVGGGGGVNEQVDEEEEEGC